MSILRRWFGPGREEMWRKLSEEMGAHYVDGGFWKGDKVEVTHGEWTITLDTYAVSTGKVTMVFTRLRAPYINPDGFRFSISRAGFFNDIAERIGLHDVRVGVEPFDDEFVIKGTDEDKLKALFANARIRDLISAQKDIHFSVKDGNYWPIKRLPDDVDELEFSVGGIIKDVDRLRLLFDLFAETLDQLCEIGSAYEAKPEILRPD